MKRILLIGDKATGKTTFLSIFLNKQLPSKYQQTLGLQAAARTIEFADRSFVNLQIWDTPGKQEYCEMANSFYENCKVFILFLDRSRKQTLDNLELWLAKIAQNNSRKESNLLVILNKTRANEEFDKESFTSEYQRLKAQNSQFKLKFKVIELDLLKQRQQIESKYIKPYLYECCGEQIVVEKSQSFQAGGAKCGEMKCSNSDCAIM